MSLNFFRICFVLGLNYLKAKYRQSALDLAVLKDRLSELLQVLNTHNKQLNNFFYACYSKRNIFMIWSEMWYKSQYSWFIYSVMPFFLKTLLSAVLWWSCKTSPVWQNRGEEACKRHGAEAASRRQGHRDITSGEAARSPNRQLDSLLMRGDKGSPWGWGAKSHVCQG